MHANSDAVNGAHASNSSGASSASSETRSETSTAPQLSPLQFEIVFNRAYHDFYNFNKLSKEAEDVMASQDVDLEDFDRLTLRKQYSRYISLIDGHIIFHEVPNAPHGQVIDCLVYSISSQIERNVFVGAVDNGITPRSHLFRDIYVQI